MRGGGGITNPEGGSPSTGTELRRQAEVRLQGNSASLENLKALPPEEAQRLLHELRIHQIDLETQNEELRRVQVELEASRLRDFEFYDLAPVGYLTVSESGLITEANHTVSRLLGRTGKELLQRPLFRFIHKEDRGRYDLHLKQLLEPCDAQPCEVRLVRSEGEPFWAQLFISTTKDAEGALAYRIVLSDITERKRAEADLMASQEIHRELSAQLNTVLESPQGVVVFALDLNYCYTTFTKAHRAVMNTIWGTDISLGMNMLKVIADPKDREKAKANFDRALAGEHLVLFEEYGSPPNRSYYENRYSPIWNEEGRVFGLTVFVIDISERKQAEAKLEAMTQRFSLAQQAGGVGVWDYDPVNNILVWDDQMYHLYGITADHFSGAYEAWKAGLHLEDLARGDAEIQMALSGESDFNTEFRVVWPDGSIHSIRALAIVQRDASGQPSRMIGTNWDITERKEAEEALQKSEELYAALFNLLPATGVVVTNAAGQIIEANLAAMEILGLSRSETLARTYDAPAWTIIRPDGTPMPVHEYASVRALRELRQVNDVEMGIRRPDGSLRWILTSAAPIPMAGLGVSITFSDITKRKDAAEALQLSERTYTGLLDSVYEAVYIQDESGRFLTVNLAAAKMYGYSKEEFVGRTPEFLSAPGKNDLSKLGEYIGKALNGEPQSFEFWGLRKDGTIFPKEVSNTLGSYFGEKVNIAVARDITERKQTEEALQRSEEQFNTAFQFVPVALAVTTMEDGRFLAVNKAFESLFGHSQEELIGRTSRAIQLWVDLKDCGDIVDFLKANRAVQNREVHFRRKDGTFRWVAYSGQLVTMNGVSCLLSASVDITERKQAETYREMLREVLQSIFEPGDSKGSIQRILTILKTGTGFDAVGIRLQDGEDFPYFAQEGFSAEFLKMENSLVARTADGGVCREPNGRVCLECTCGLVLSGKTDPTNPLFTSEGSAWTNDSFPLRDIPLDEDPRLHPRNQCIHQGYASIALVPIRDSKGIAGLIHFNDRRKDCFTLERIQLLEGIGTRIGEALERKRSEEARTHAEGILQRSELKHRLLFDRAGDAIFIHNAAEMLAVNPMACERLGYTQAELMALATGAVDAPDQVQHVPERIARLMEQGSLTFETVHQRKDSSLVPTELRSSRITWDDQPAILSICRDLTERNQAEEERRKLHAQLQQSQKMESLGILAGGVAHDMNNVLGAILGMASANILAQPVESPAYHAFDTISQAAVRGGKMVKSLLGFARQSPAEEEELDINAILREEVNLLERTTLAKIGLQLDLGPELRRVRGDASALTHAFMNLCVNAVDAMPDNGTLTLRTRNVDKDWIEVVVEDSGTGMPKEVLEKALDPFYTTKPIGKGTGLGLSMVFTTVKAHRGQMEIQSEPGKGTRVMLRFPASDPLHPDAEPAQVPGSETTQGALTVLMVDDDDLIQSCMKAIIEVLGHTGITAQSGEEALLKLEAGLEPDVVILDMNMPGLAGAGTLPRLRALRPTVPVLLATGRVDEAVLELAKAHPFVTLLAKPFTMKDLQQYLESMGREGGSSA